MADRVDHVAQGAGVLVFQDFQDRIDLAGFFGAGKKFIGGNAVLPFEGFDLFGELLLFGKDCIETGKNVVGLDFQLAGKGLDRGFHLPDPLQSLHAGNGCNTPCSGGNRFVGNDFAETDLAGAVQVGAAAELF